MSDETSSPIYGAALDNISDRLSEKKYSVVLEGVNRKYETTGSFAIKFSLLAKIPVTRIRNLLRSCPSTIWNGRDHRKALYLLKLIEEAGGTASVKEEEINKKGDKPEPVEEELLCPKCGFPLKEGDEFCGFCSTPIGEHSEKKETISIPKVSKSAIPLWRLVFYLAVLVSIIIYAIISF